MKGRRRRRDDNVISIYIAQNSMHALSRPENVDFNSQPSHHTQRKRWNDENMRDDESEKRGKMMAVIKIPITIWPNDFFMLPTHQNDMNTRNAFLARSEKISDGVRMCVASIRRKDQHIFSAKYRLIVLLISNDSKSKSSFHILVGRSASLTQHTLCLCVYLRHERSLHPRNRPHCCLLIQIQEQITDWSARWLKGKRHRMFPSNNNTEKHSKQPEILYFCYIFNRKRSL